MSALLLRLDNKYKKQRKKVERLKRKWLLIICSVENGYSKSSTNRSYPPSCHWDESCANERVTRNKEVTMLNQLQDRTHIAINQVTRGASTQQADRQAVKVSGAADGVWSAELARQTRSILSRCDTQRYLCKRIQQAHSITLFYVRNSNAIYFNTNCTLLVIFNFKVD